MSVCAQSQKLQHAMPVRKRRVLYLVLLALVVFGVTGLIWLTTGSREFSGRLVYESARRGREAIPEDPFPDAWLVTPTRTYELVIPGCTGRGVDRALCRRLAALDGSQVIVRGRIGTRRTLMKEHPGAIFVEDFKPAPVTK